MIGGLIVERRRLKNPWIDHAWVADAVLVGMPTAAPWTVLDEAPHATRFYAGSIRLDFFSTATGSYRDNLRSGRPTPWVPLRPSASPPVVVLKPFPAAPADAHQLPDHGTDKND